MKATQHFERTNDTRCGKCSQKMIAKFDVPIVEPGSFVSFVYYCPLCSHNTRFNFVGEKIIEKKQTPEDTMAAIKQFIVDGQIDKKDFFKKLTPIRVKAQEGDTENDE